MLFSTKLSSEERMVAYRSIQEGSTWSSRYVLMLALSTIIATFGLLSNSTAVVIGAMIIAPLMGPILGLAMGMVSGSSNLQKKSAWAESVGVVICVGIAFLIGRCTMSVGATDEMMARTAPTTFDLAIALACGMAGGYASVNEKVNAALAGVAISVALVPPLATCGLLLAFGRTDLGLGALLLWFANFVAIQLAAAAVYALYGFIRGKTVESGEGKKILLRFAPSIVALGLVGWFLTTTLIRLVEEKIENAVIQSILFDQVARRTGGRLESILQIERRSSELRIVASALTPQPFESEQVAQIEAALSQELKVETSLILRSIVSVDVGSKGRVYLSDSEASRMSDASGLAEFLEKARQSLQTSLAGHEAAELVEVDRRGNGGGTVIMAVVRAPEPVMPEEVRTAEDALEEILGEPVTLVVRSINTRDAGRDGFLYQPVEAAPDPKVESLRSRLEPILTRRLPDLSTFSVDQRSDHIRVTATVQAATSPDVAEVTRLANDLRSNVDPSIRLFVKVDLVITPVEASPDAVKRSP